MLIIERLKYTSKMSFTNLILSCGSKHFHSPSQATMTNLKRVIDIQFNDTCKIYNRKHLYLVEANFGGSYKLTFLIGDFYFGRFITFENQIKIVTCHICCAIEYKFYDSSIMKVSTVIKIIFKTTILITFLCFCFSLAPRYYIACHVK